MRKQPTTVNQQLTSYSDKESFGYIKERYPEENWRDELQPYIEWIVEMATEKHLSACQALNHCLKISNQEADKIYFMAAFYLIRTKNTMELRTLKEVEHDIHNCKLKLHLNETSIKTQEDKAYTNEAITREIYKLQDELETIKEQYQIDPNTIIEGVIVKADGSEEIL